MTEPPHRSARGEQTRLQRVRADVGIGPYGAPAPNAPASDLFRRGAHRASAPRSGLLRRVRLLHKAISPAAPKAPLCKGGCHGVSHDWGIVTPPSGLRPATSPKALRALGEAWAGATGVLHSQGTMGRVAFLARVAARQGKPHLGRCVLRESAATQIVCKYVKALRPLQI